MSSPPRRELDPTYAEVTALVAERAGMVFAPNRDFEAQAGIARAMARAGTGDLAAYLFRVSNDQAVFDALADELRVPETYFMRHPEQLELVRRELLPALQHGRGVHPVRVWSAGCATGEEAYSLAILIEQSGANQGALVLGTDLSASALDKARAASYSDWAMRGVSARFIADYFLQVQQRHVLLDRIRKRVRFAQLNLAGSHDYATVGATGMDLILCRNVLIYFGRETAGRIATRLFDCLAPGGVLLTAGADPLLAEHAPFEVEVTSAGLVYRRSCHGPARALPAASRPWQLADEQPATPSPPAPPVTVAVPAPAHADLGQQAFVRITELSNAKGALQAERVAEAALRRHPLDAPLHYLRATLLLALDRDEEAEDEAERALYLDRSLAVAHFLLGTILRKRGADADALRAFRNVRDLCAARPPDEEVPAGGGERSGALHAAAAAELTRLAATLG